MTNEAQKQKAEAFRKLHESFLVLPNSWDVLGAALVRSMGFPAIATASAAIAWSNGYQDAEQIPFEQALGIIKAIARSTELPVTADIESGYSNSLPQLKENIRKLIEAGAVGINIEDFDHSRKRFFPVEEQSGRLQLIRRTAEEMGISLFINARVDVYTKPGFGEEEKLETLLQRGRAYIDAGADCLFPIGVSDKEVLSLLVKEWERPINVLYFPGVPNLRTLEEIGVRRVSFGPNLLKVAMFSVRRFLKDLSEPDGLDVLENEAMASAEITKLLSENC